MQFYFYIFSLPEQTLAAVYCAYVPCKKNGGAYSPAVSHLNTSNDIASPEMP
jgi:hypothetical protein